MSLIEVMISGCITDHFSDSSFGKSEVGLNMIKKNLTKREEDFNHRWETNAAIARQSIIRVSHFNVYSGSI